MASSSPFEGPRDSLVDSALDTPRGSAYLGPPGALRDSSALRDSTISTPAESSPFLPQTNKEAAFDNSRDVLPSPRRRPLYRRPWFWVAAIVAIVVVALAVVLPIIFVVVKPGQHHSPSSGSSTGSSGSNDSGSNGQTGSNGSGSTPQGAIKTGGDGSTVTKDDGSTFVYHNSFGGYCECFFVRSSRVFRSFASRACLERVVRMPAPRRLVHARPGSSRGPSELGQLGASEAVHWSSPSVPTSRSAAFGARRSPSRLGGSAYGLNAPLLLLRESVFRLLVLQSETAGAISRL